MLFWLDSSAERDEMTITLNSAKGTVVVPIAHVLSILAFSFSNDKDYELTRMACVLQGARRLVPKHKLARCKALMIYLLPTIWCRFTYSTYRVQSSESSTGRSTDGVSDGFRQPQAAFLSTPSATKDIHNYMKGT